MIKTQYYVQIQFLMESYSEDQVKEYVYRLKRVLDTAPITNLGRVHNMQVTELKEYGGAAKEKIKMQ